jgi:hypothetical protein
LQQDLDRVRGALERLPDRLFHGDRASFARALGIDRDFRFRRSRAARARR